MNNFSQAEAFQCTYNTEVVELLSRLNCSLVISTYQAGKIIFLSPQKNGSMVQLPRTFSKPMGIAVNTDNSKIAIACKDEIIVFSNSSKLGFHYPAKPKTYDAFFTPRLTYHTGNVDIHDLLWGNEKLFAVNTLFSCIVTFDDNYNFTPYWKPPFISKLVSEDRCHLNGMILIDGEPRYTTSFSNSDTFQGWRENITKSGILFDIKKNETIIENLPMPHSPRMINGEIYLLLSATSELVKINIEKRNYEVIAKMNGFVRGMAHYNDYLFIGLSKLRKSSSTFSKLEIAEKPMNTGVCILQLSTGKIIGELIYNTSVEEIYDVHVLPNITRPNILNTIRPEYKMGLSIPGSTFWSLPENENK
ncbi:MAG TPA: TIGR03032 family protein [Bacteroidales bacterium]|nr:TIGR03032 family protein [Bacteroidales bacterium]HPS17310.1 TIGR03032 family protein [Bacteroidales bacterium]